MNICEFLYLNFNLKLDLLRQPRGGARGPGPREWGPRGSLTVHGGPGARGSLRPAPRAPRVSRTRGRGRLTAGPHAAATRCARRQPRRRGRREAAPSPRWSPTATTGTAEQRPREGRERGKRNGGPRLTPSRRRRRKRRPERRKAAARLGSTGSTAFRRSASEAEGWTRSARMRRSRRRRRRGGRWSGATTAADRSLAATAERESDGAGSIPTGRKGGEWRKRWRGARGWFI
uniref:Splicing coactivator subunit-like n=1 Tax=Oryza sativa subsp. japonica TaxID=39947 RepID=Q6EPA8_ORYSJ|nr:splicing coactivator subunit-like [Oryza sativa Japonica Group]